MHLFDYLIDILVIYLDDDHMFSVGKDVAYDKAANCFV